MIDTEGAPTEGVPPDCVMTPAVLKLTVQVRGSSRLTGSESPVKVCVRLARGMVKVDTAYAVPPLLGLSAPPPPLSPNPSASLFV